MAPGANVIAFAIAGGDTVNLIKQSAEFGQKQDGQVSGLILPYRCGSLPIKKCCSVA